LGGPVVKHIYLLWSEAIRFRWIWAKYEYDCDKVIFMPRIIRLPPTCVVCFTTRSCLTKTPKGKWSGGDGMVVVVVQRAV